MRQALFFDIDGTILSEITKEIPQSTFRALSKAKENGHLLFINTGRTRCTLPIKITEMPFDGFLCGCGIFLTYGDGVSDVNISELLNFHRKGGRMATLTTVQPMGRFGSLDIREDGEIKNFREKKIEDSGWINAGFMVLEPEIMDLIQDDTTVFEKYPLEEAARRGQLDAYRHEGFWQCMDTMSEKKKLEAMWAANEAPWKVWE